MAGDGGFINIRPQAHGFPGEMRLEGAGHAVVHDKTVGLKGICFSRMASLAGPGTGREGVCLRHSKSKRCDTPYASWKPEGTDLTIEEILTKIRTSPAARHVMLTGGEPMENKNQFGHTFPLAGV